MSTKTKALIASAVVVVAAAIAIVWLRLPEEPPPIKVGVLHSLTGTMAISETSMVDATLLAIDEINEQGGLLGRQIEAVVADGRSSWPTFAAEAGRLIEDENVSVVFGCWTSASRKTVKPIFEARDHLLFYPVQYEGLEQSPNIVYTGAAPNQQIIPAVKWVFDNLGKRVYLIASDYVFPRAANAIIKHQVAALQGEVVGERYLLLGSADVSEAVQEIVRTRPDVVLNTINGDSNAAFFRELRAAGIIPQAVPVMSFSLAEDELRTLDGEHMVGDYATWNYFQTIDTDENRAFVAAFQTKYGVDRVTDDPMEAAYVGVHLWAQAVRQAGTADPRAVRKVIGGQSLAAPEGIVSVDPETQHTWRSVRVGRIRADGQFDIVWDSGRPIRPAPYPAFRTRRQWDAFLLDLQKSWGGAWANPG